MSIHKRGTRPHTLAINRGRQDRLKAARTVQMSHLELARELGLRRWARANYVPPEQRFATWHPIVLSEMQSRDSELAEISTPAPVSARYVPLLPTLPTGDRILRSAEASRQTSSLAHYGSSAGGTSWKASAKSAGMRRGT